MSDKMNFTKQKIRTDILINILKNNTANARELFDMLKTDNNSTDDDSRRGFIFETISIILLVSKCLKIKYTNIMLGKIRTATVCKNINDLLDKPIPQGKNPVDIMVKQDNMCIPITIKYKNKFMPNSSGVSEIDGEANAAKIKDYKIGLIVRDKKVVEAHKYDDDGGNQKVLHDKVIKNGLLFDETDIIDGLE